MLSAPRRATYDTPLTALVQQSYLIHYTRNTRRKRFQLQQLPLLGVELSIVTGYDAEQMTPHLRRCLLPANSSLALAYASQTLKLYVALYDMLSRCYRTVLVFEDDAVLRYEYLHSLALALGPMTHGVYSLLFAGSYSVNGVDLNPVGLRPRSSSARRFMPAIGVAIAAPAAAHVLHSLPIEAAIDATLSDAALASCPCREKRRNGTSEACLYLKPYPVKAGSNGISRDGRTGLFGREGVGLGGGAAAAEVEPRGKPADGVRLSHRANATWCCARARDPQLPRGLPLCASVCESSAGWEGPGGTSFCVGCRLRWKWPAMPTLPGTSIDNKLMVKRSIMCLKCTGDKYCRFISTIDAT
ncbi:hypothetical protein AB1Y20_017781 [Prymnesium parvum]|uniref:Uncharacterized protein n=1 Tax=Prymnesium parvum TaxID=97485 RepID=A0AB34JQD9_PRYPA